MQLQDPKRIELAHVPVEALDSILGITALFESDEGETAGAASLAVLGNKDILDATELLEAITKIALRDLKSGTKQTGMSGEQTVPSDWRAKRRTRDQ